MATRRSSKKASAPEDATPASVEPQDEVVAAPKPAAKKTAPKPEPAPAPAEEFGAQDLAQFLQLPKGYDKKECDAVLAAAVTVAEDYIGRKVKKISHEYKMAVQLLAGKMYASGSLKIGGPGEIPGKIRYFLELVKNSK